MPITYFGTKISDNIIQTPAVGEVGKPGEPDYQPGIPGFLICRDVIIARDGFQKYLIAELPQEDAEKLGIDVSNPGASIEVYRPHDEVFSDATRASMEGLVLTDSHPQEFVNRENWRDLTYGHAQNLRKGKVPLSDGNWPLLADFIINADPLATDVEQRRKRSVSVGYNYKLARDGDKIIQTEIRGNHIAVLHDAAGVKGRAGPEARIYDEAAAADAAQQDSSAEPEVAPPTKLAIEPERRQIQQKEKRQVKATNMLKHLLGLGLKQYATDADPEELAEAAKAVKDAEGESEEEKEKKASDAKKAKDAAEEESKKAKEKEETDRKAKDARDADEKKMKDAAEEKEKADKDKEAKDADAKAAKDAEAEQTHFQPCKVKDCGARDCKMHGALDSVLKAHPEDDDADVKQLGELLAEHQMSPEAEAMGGDESEVIEPVEEMGGDAATDAAARAADARETERQYILKQKPIVARSNDAAARKALNIRIKAFNGKSKASDATYARVAGAAGAPRSKTGGAPEAVNYNEMDAAYKARLNGTDHKEVTN